MVVNLTLEAKHKCHRKKDAFDLELIFFFFLVMSLEIDPLFNKQSTPTDGFDFIFHFISRDQESAPHRKSETQLLKKIIRGIKVNGIKNKLSAYLTIFVKSGLIYHLI